MQVPQASARVSWAGEASVSETVSPLALP
jgi:hypothetical protein